MDFILADRGSVEPVRGSRQPRLLFLDERSAGLARQSRTQLQRLHSLHANGECGVVVGGSGRGGRG